MTLTVQQQSLQILSRLRRTMPSMFGLLLAITVGASSMAPAARVRVMVQRSFGVWDSAAPHQFRLRLEPDDNWETFVSRVATRAGHRGFLSDLRLLDTTRAELKVPHEHNCFVETSCLQRFPMRSMSDPVRPRESYRRALMRSMPTRSLPSQTIRSKQRAAH